MGRHAWWSRLLWWGAVLSATAAALRFVFGPGIAHPRIDVVVLGGLSLVLMAGWAWAGSRTHPGPGVAASLEKVSDASSAPPPPNGIPLRRLPFLGAAFAVVLALVLLPVLVVELASRPDGGDLRRISAIQKAGAEVRWGQIVSIDNARDSGYTPYPDHDFDRADLVLEVPGPGSEKIRVKAPRAHVPWNDDGKKGDWVEVLYAPSDPAVGGYVDTRDRFLTPYADDSWWSWSLPIGAGSPTLFIVMFPGAVALVVLAFLWHKERRLLRSDARAGKVFARRGRITGTLREEYRGRPSGGGAETTLYRHGLRMRVEDGERRLLNTAQVMNPLVFAWAGHRDGWLIGSPRWEERPGFQYLAFVTDDGRVLWLTVDRETALWTKKQATVETGPRTGLRHHWLPRPLVLRQELRRLAFFALAYGLLLPVLLTPLTNLWSILLTIGALAAGLAGAFRGERAGETPYWKQR
ncbi:hypothetical protein [Streptomyces yaizuensis]|uniref:DUF3592 domain-containing protein n=1 Tax=Streptomyces yaizuensis TaxID=2989713 RepID=A0ABQ5NX66_9ACTN|nr:hypothetical protein [Streptomyces sp. YSPA8]GLF94566.1 hypothetical protein SYYSPA8_09735 [Streptomyces sp. YSPA8]